MKPGMHGAWSTVATLAFLVTHTAAAALYGTYQGNGSQSPSGIVGLGQLTLSANSSSVTGQFKRGGSDGATFQDVLVIYIDSKPGGYSGTGSFMDNNDGENGFRRAVSGYNRPGYRSTAYFAPGFQADYAIALSPGLTGGWLYELNTSTELYRVANVYLNPSDSGLYRDYSFNFSWETIGLGDSADKSFNFQTTYITSSGSRSLESFEQVTGVVGFNEVYFGNYNSFPPVPEPTNMALAAFAGLLVSVGVAKKARQAWRNHWSDSGAR